MKILDTLNAQNETLIEPRTPNPDDAEVIGELTEELKNLYTSYILCKRDAERLSLDCTHCDDEEARVDLRRQVCAAAELKEVVKKVFWFEVAEVFNLHGEPEIGVAKGWLVWVKDQSMRGTSPGVEYVAHSLDEFIGLLGFLDRAP